MLLTVTKPTRIGKTSATLIDNIIVYLKVKGYMRNPSQTPVVPQNIKHT